MAVVDMKVNQNVAVIDIGICNSQSVVRMLNQAGFVGEIVTDPDLLSEFRAAVLPGVGSWDAALTILESSGWDKCIQAYAASDGVLLGICLGMQLLGSRSEEGSKRGLSIIPGEVTRMRASDSFKVPNVGWCSVNPCEGADVDIHGEFYFVHSFRFSCDTPANLVATSTHSEGPFAAAISNNRNVIGVQFHPEKSHQLGARLFRQVFGE